MAVYYTDFLSGDDTTGDGSWANPYKTIYQGTLALTANGDEVRVKGSDFSAALPGTLTFTYNSNTVQTSEDLTSLFPELVGANDKVIITVDDDYGYGRTVCTVTAVTSTTLTLHTQWVGRSAAFGVKRLNTQHYYITALPTAPSGQSGWVDTIDKTNVSLYTDIKVTGGWTAEGVQSGMTAFVNARVGATSSADQCIFMNSNTQRGQELLVSNFAATHFVAYMNSTGQRMAWGKHWFIRISNTVYSGSSSGIWMSKLNEPIEFHAYDSVINGSWSVGFGGEGVNNQWKIWQTGGQSLGNSKFGTTTENKDILEYYFITRSTDQTLGFPNQGFFGNFTNTIRIGDFYLYNNGTPGYLPLLNSRTNFRTLYIAKVFYSGNSACSLSAINIGSGQATIGDGTQDLLSASWPCGGGWDSSQRVITTTQSAFRIRGLGGEIARLYSNVTAGQYAHQQQLVNVSTTEFVTGDSSLQLWPSNRFSGTSNGIQLVGAIPAFNDTRTVTLKMKTNGIDNSIWNRVEFYDAAGNDIYTLELSVDGNWTDYTFTFTPSNIDVNSTQYFTIGIEYLQSTVQSASRLYIDSISVA